MRLSTSRSRSRTGRPGYIPKLIKLTRSGAIKPETLLTKTEPIADVIEAYKHFDRREPGRLKVALDVLR